MACFAKNSFVQGVFWYEDEGIELNKKPPTDLTIGGEYNKIRGMINHHYRFHNRVPSSVREGNMF